MHVNVWARSGVCWWDRVAEVDGIVVLLVEWCEGEARLEGWIEDCGET